MKRWFVIRAATENFDGIWDRIKAKDSVAARDLINSIDQPSKNVFWVYTWLPEMDLRMLPDVQDAFLSLRKESSGGW